MTILCRYPGGRNLPDTARSFWGYRRGDGHVYCGKYYNAGQLDSAQKLGHTVRGPFIAEDRFHAADIMRRRLEAYDAKRAEEKAAPAIAPALEPDLTEWF